MQRIEVKDLFLSIVKILLNLIFSWKSFATLFTGFNMYLHNLSFNSYEKI